MRIKLLLLFIIIFHFFGHGQVDKEFWFVAPDITQNHSDRPIFLRISTLNQPATVSVTQPRNAGNFPEIIVDIPANTTETIDLTPRINQVEATVTPTFRTNKGIFIESKTNTPITAYYEVRGNNAGGNPTNPDLFSLKGNNALGTEFYTPFQNHWNNAPVNQAFSSIHIVATEDNTNFTIIPTRPIQTHQGVKPAGVPFTVTGLQKGETYMIFPAAFSKAAGDRLSGSIITSNKPIAVTMSDDSIKGDFGTCYDLVGDQLIPTSLIGKEYIAMRGQLQFNPGNPATIEERIFICATENGTTIDVTDITNANTITDTKNDQETMEYLFPDGSEMIYVNASAPVYVFHVTGWQCEAGGAILPSVDTCTGSAQVSFTRATNNEFFMNIMTRDGAEGFFLLDGAPSPLIPGTGFTDIPGDWTAIRIGPVNATDIPALVQKTITNTKDVFHLGIINGQASVGCYYGYFSDYKALAISALIVGSGSDLDRLCWGESTQLHSEGASPNGFFWTMNPDNNSLSDPNVQNPYAFPTETTTYTVHVSGYCDMNDSAQLTIQVADYIDSDVEVFPIRYCAPADSIPIRSVSVGVENFLWDLYENGIHVQDIDWVGHDKSYKDTTFYFNINNITPTPNYYDIVLNSTSDFDACDEYDTLSFIVYPQVIAQFDISDTLMCDSTVLQLTNNTINGYTYNWDFGSFGSSLQENPSFLVRNFTSNPITDTVKLIATASPTNNLCQNQTQKSFTVHPHIQPDFSFDTTWSCYPYEFTFYNSSINQDAIANYHIDFNGVIPVYDSTEFTNINRTFTYFNPTADSIVIPITLTVENDLGCPKSITRKIVLYPPIEASFSPSDTIGCNPLTVQFTNNSSGAGSYQWEFGDTASSYQSSPVHTFTNKSAQDKTFSVLLKAIASNLRCTDDTIVNITVHPYINAGFTFAPGAHCHPYDAVFYNSSENQAAITNYEWTIDGNTQNDPNFDSLLYTFTNPDPSTTPATYPINLIVYNSAGCSDDTNRTVIVYPEVISDFVPNPSNGCHPLFVQMQNQSNAAASIFEWTFDDGGASSSQTNPSYTFINYSNELDSIYFVNLKAKSIYQCWDTLTIPVIVYPVPDAAFEMDAYAGCSPYEVNFTNLSVADNASYEWDFQNDGIVDSFEENPTFTFTNPTDTTIKEFTIKLKVFSEHICIDSITHVFRAYPEVRASFEADPVAGCNPVDVTFTNTSSLAKYYDWDFGDGSFHATNTNPTHLFENYTVNTETFEVILTATSMYNCVDSANTTITVYPAPIAEFIADPYQQPYQAGGVNVDFTNKTSAGSWNYHWTFGDGNTSNLKDPTNTYVWTGTDYSTKKYEVNLFATNGQCSDSFFDTVIITSPVPVVVFSSDTVGCQPFRVKFFNYSMFGYEADAYLWDFGDGFQSTEAEPTHLYDTSGTFRVRLSVSGPGGTALGYENITVHRKPIANYKVEPNYIELPGESITIINNSQFADNYFWNFGNGVISEEENPNTEDTYTESGLYNITLIASTDTEPVCYDTLVRESIVRAVEKCDILFPNAFRPNTTGSLGGRYDPRNPDNKVFYPIHRGITDYRLEIFNQWGELIFVSEDLNIGWDGYYRDKLAKQDVYVWKVTAKCSNGEEINEAGDVTLIH